MPVVRDEDARILENFHMKCQRQILNIKQQDYVRNIDVANQSGLPPVIYRIIKPRNFVYIARMLCTVPV